VKEGNTMKGIASNTSVLPKTSDSNSIELENCARSSVSGLKDKEMERD
jgi:hypothetical protein